MAEEASDDLDPGIRATVAWLQSEGFDTTDSGDGVTKLADGWSPREALDVPHVHMAVAESHLMTSEALRLWARLRRLGIDVSACGEGPVYIQATYDPATAVAILSLFGVNDEMLAGRLTANAS